MNCFIGELLEITFHTWTSENDLGIIPIKTELIIFTKEHKFYFLFFKAIALYIKRQGERISNIIDMFQKQSFKFSLWMSVILLDLSNPASWITITELKWLMTPIGKHGYISNQVNAF